MSHPDPLFLPYRETLELLSVEDAMRVCEETYRMHARGSVRWSSPPSLRLDAAAPFHNHWHVKGTLLDLNVSYPPAIRGQKPRLLTAGQ